MIPWIKTQVKKIFGSVENPYYKKLRKSLASQKALSQYKRIYFLGGFEYSDDIYSRFKEHLNAGELKSFFQITRYNAQGDNVELYLIENDESTYLLTLLDSFELLNGEQVLDVIRSPRIKLQDVSHELVYSDPS